MNYIAGNLLYHAEEYIAFWLLEMLFEKLELRDVYLPSKIYFIINRQRFARAFKAFTNDWIFNSNINACALWAFCKLVLYKLYF